jgi:plastocyanin
VPSRPRIVAAALVISFTMLAAACQPNHPENRATQATPVVDTERVVAKDMAFTPIAVQVPAGTTVTWSFEDGNVSHNIKGDGFESRTLSKGTFRHRFARPGTFDYVCTLHTGMTGRVVVAPE